MQECINHCTLPLYLQDTTNIWWREAKLSTEWLDLIFPIFYQKLNIPQDFYKRDYYQLISLMEVDSIDEELIAYLDLIYNTIV